MDSNLAIDISREALILVIKISFPLLIAAVLVGLIVSLIQALTQIQDQTITFVPKLITIFIVLFFIMPYIGNLMLSFNETISNQIVNIK